MTVQNLSIPAEEENVNDRKMDGASKAPPVEFDNKP